MGDLYLIYATTEPFNDWSSKNMTPDSVEANLSSAA